MFKHLLKGVLCLALLFPNGANRVQEETPKEDLYCSVYTHIMWWYNDEERQTIDFKTKEDYLNWVGNNDDTHKTYYEYNVTLYQEDSVAVLCSAKYYKVYSNSNNFKFVDRWGNEQNVISPNSGTVENFYVYDASLSPNMVYNMENLGALHLVNCVIDGNNQTLNHSMFNVKNGGFLVLDNTTIKNFHLAENVELVDFIYDGEWYGQYALLRGSNNATIENITSQNNGIMRLESYNAQIEGMTFKNCTSDDDGGAVYIAFGIVDGCTFINNHSNGDGGAIYMDDIEYGQVRNCKFINNSCEDDGGAIYIDVESGWVHDCYFEGNNSGVDGGAICINGDKSSVNNCQFVNNKADDDGGAIYVCVGTDDVDIENCTFSGNHADDDCDDVDGRSDTHVFNTGSTISNNPTWFIIIEILTILIAIVVILFILKRRPKVDQNKK